MENINDSKKGRAAGKICGIMLYIAAALMLTYSVFLCFSPDIWYDELFSVEFAIRPVSEMVNLTAADVHPPLYYIIVHFAIEIGSYIADAVGFTGPFGSEFGTVYIQVLSAKLSCVVPYVILFIYGVTAIRKRHGILAGGLFSAAMLAMPNMADYTIEIRMYGWLILFVTAMCIHAMPFIPGDLNGKMVKGLDIKRAFPVFVYGLLACYTQYYAAVAVAAVYAFLVIYSIRKNVWQLGIVFIIMNLTFICYLPWISVVFSQAGTVSENYWIQPLTWRSLGGIAKYLILPSFTNVMVGYVFAGLLMLIIALAALIGRKNVYMWFLLAPITGIVIAGFAASILIRPVFVYRYMLPGMGAFWYGIIMVLFSDRKPWAANEDKDAGDLSGASKADSYKRGAFGSILTVAVPAFAIIMAVVIIRDFWAFRGNELYKRVNMAETGSLFTELKAEDDLAIITNFDHVNGLISYYLNQSGKEIPVYLYGGEPEALITKMVKGVAPIENADDIKALIEGGKHVIFLGSFNSREDIVADWDSNYGIANENKGSYLMERYWFDVFDLSLKAD
ncbi:hypothetical protein [Butyrivibrio sp. WCD3002]|uniref:hypothetical protein n=1 Tax=Butyrivibrio sp. WCD3002 TaxID=1280676 RepID=UPI000420BB9A|nr:hypothetical protein [Butyrivibrio sp. WCD3002]